MAVKWKKIEAAIKAMITMCLVCVRERYVHVQAFAYMLTTSMMYILQPSFSTSHY